MQIPQSFPSRSLFFFALLCSQQSSSFLTSHRHGSKGYGQTPGRRSGIEQAFCAPGKSEARLYLKRWGRSRIHRNGQISRSPLTFPGIGQGFYRSSGPWLRRPRHHNILRRLSASMFTSSLACAAATRQSRSNNSQSPTYDSFQTFGPENAVSRVRTRT